ncbi:hypothetical protein NEOLI_000432 [Neolecta irregularis DAH-3]|uniref:Uncharacterized protein n=1 Tax=Neolecta irregularis (strain DAH-3) TaxID=1198029 RepID=A0A1U7LWT2_NEOID|nr:hypothetical protein NEOLI_000432 [Neolecta irregularis DAH-3]|eukprot:OLL27136.1 hypothetical protein NEOLI_000432 [Neolecta irregularis DAH-3]
MESVRLSWRQSAHNPDVYVRDRAATELLMDIGNVAAQGLYSAATHVTFHIPPSALSGKELICRVKTAWKEMRRTSPHISVNANGPFEARYLRYERPRSEADIDAWAERSLEVMDASKRGISLADFQTYLLDPSHCHTEVTPAEGQETKSPKHVDFRLKFVQNDTTGDHFLGISCNHVMSDGIGGHIFFGRMLKLIAKGVPKQALWDFAGEPERLSPSAPLQFGIRKEGEPLSAETVDELNTHFENLVSKGPSQGVYTNLSPKDYKPTMAKSSHYTVVIEKEDFDAIRKTWKAKGYTITQAMNAALSLACYKLESRKTGKSPDTLHQIWPFNIINGRPHFKAPYKNATHHFQCSFVFFPSSTSIDTFEGKDDQLVLEQAAAESKQNWNSALKSPNTLNWSHETVLKTLELDAETPADSDKMPYLSSVGLVDKYYQRVIPTKSKLPGSLMVRDVGTGVKFCGKETSLHITGFNGRAFVNFSYDECWYPREDVKWLTDETLRLMRAFK